MRSGTISNPARQRMPPPASLSIQRIGDCKAPGLIAHAVYDGHRTARRIDGDQATAEDLPEEPPFRRDRVVIPAVL